jgi:hypothetical protein
VYVRGAWGDGRGGGFGWEGFLFFPFYFFLVDSLPTLLLFQNSRQSTKWSETVFDLHTECVVGHGVRLSSKQVSDF